MAVVHVHQTATLAVKSADDFPYSHRNSTKARRGTRVRPKSSTGATVSTSSELVEDPFAAAFERILHPRHVIDLAFQSHSEAIGDSVLPFKFIPRLESYDSWRDNPAMCGTTVVITLHSEIGNEEVNRGDSRSLIDVTYYRADLKEIIEEVATACSDFTPTGTYLNKLYNSERN